MHAQSSFSSPILVEKADALIVDGAFGAGDDALDVLPVAHDDDQGAGKGEEPKPGPLAMVHQAQNGEES